jgi:hypothetical protein
MSGRIQGGEVSQGLGFLVLLALAQISGKALGIAHARRDARAETEKLKSKVERSAARTRKVTAELRKKRAEKTRSKARGKSRPTKAG